MTMNSFVPVNCQYGTRTMDKGFEKLRDMSVVALAQELNFSLNRLYRVRRLLQSKHVQALRLQDR